MAWKKGQSGNPGGRKKGKTLNALLLEAFNRAAKKERTTLADLLVNKALEDTKLLSKLLDKVISDAPKDVNLKAEGARFIVVTKGDINW